uniref:Regulator of microtubule dynamics protein 1 n=1 Tax=Ditylenchus dipsaci TaxID=166011 RepID=A0A915ERW6_9BILA
MFRTFASRLFRRHFPVLGRSVKYCITAGGAATGGASLSLSFFSGETTARSQADVAAMSKELDVLVHIRESDVFYDNYMLDRAYEILQKYKSSDNPELLWRLARVLCELGKNAENNKEKKRLFSEALEVAKSALDYESNARDGKCFAAHKWYAIVLNYVSEQEGTKSQIKNSVDVKTHFERAVQLNPLDPTSWHLLGVWHFSFADLSGMSRMAASAFFASPPSSTFEEALHHFQRAEVVQPGKEETVEWFKKAFQAPVLTKDDMETHVRAAEHLTKKYGFSKEKLAALISNRP